MRKGAGYSTVSEVADETDDPSEQVLAQDLRKIRRNISPLQSGMLTRFIVHHPKFIAVNGGELLKPRGGEHLLSKTEHLPLRSPATRVEPMDTLIRPGPVTKMTRESGSGLILWEPPLKV